MTKLTASIVLTLTFAFVAACGIVGNSTPNPADYPACPTEDSVGPCYWDGGSNGLGNRFIVTDSQEVVILP